MLRMLKQNDIYESSGRSIWCKRYSINGVSFILKVRTEARILNSALPADLDPCQWAKWNSLYLQVRSALPAAVSNLVCGEPGGFWGTGLWPPDREHQRGCLADNRVELSDFSYIAFYLSFYVITTLIPNFIVSEIRNRLERVFIFIFFTWHNVQQSESNSHQCKSLHSGFCHLPWLPPAMGSLPGKTFMWSQPSCRTDGLKISIARFSVSNNFHPSPRLFFFFPQLGWLLGNDIITFCAGLPFLLACLLRLASFEYACCF